MLNNTTYIVGLGKTGWSCLEYLNAKALPLKVFDTRTEPPQLAALKHNYPHIPYQLGPLAAQDLLNASQIVCSPGVDLQLPALVAAANAKIPIIGDIELFAQSSQRPLVAVTGSNGKSTVVSLVAEMLKVAAVSAGVGGNLGEPALNLLAQEAKVQWQILELSSFQLATTFSLQPKIAALLNITPDHLDRHQDLATYQAIKQRIYHNAQTVIFNRQDARTFPMANSAQQQLSFGLDAPVFPHFGLRTEQGRVWLCQGQQLLVPQASLALQAPHNVLNSLCALAIGLQMGLPQFALQQALAQFKGLAHRCQWVGTWQGISWINDSKATNIGACIAALYSIGHQVSGKIILIAGGQGKGVDFSALQLAVSTQVKQLLVIGEAGPLLSKVFAQYVPVLQLPSLEAAIIAANDVATTGDAVLLSPACSSLDQYPNYRVRGQEFIERVTQLKQGQTNAS
jgi:UDP-N-acetylmuramoylalanine--D-glutamate ligase